MPQKYCTNVSAYPDSHCISVTVHSIPDLCLLFRLEPVPANLHYLCRYTHINVLVDIVDIKYLVDCFVILSK